MPAAIFPSKRAPAYQNVPDEPWNDWRWQLRHRIRDVDALMARTASRPLPAGILAPSAALAREGTLAFFSQHLG